MSASFIIERTSIVAHLMKATLESSPPPIKAIPALECQRAPTTISLNGHDADVPIKHAPLKNRLFRSQHLPFGDALLLPNLSHLGLGYFTASISHSEMYLYCQAFPTWDYALLQPAASIWRCTSAAKPLPLGPRLFRNQHLPFGDTPLLLSISHLELSSSAASISHSEMHLCCRASSTWE
ncbi:hypothetical protein Adt_38864 [Abeliophyllum distichum]|uniref:Uncharacterized protein n=1 Tax=Abeliophyllum distichum TaxID=126358 RepID=A0ABD1Q3G2_9LAMI